MSSNFSFSIAEKKDDEELRAIMRNVSMPGPISLSFCREPSYFLAENIGCIKSETMICRQINTGKIVGIGCRSLWNIYYLGQVKKIYYLHSLRSLDPKSNGTLLLRAYKYFRSLPDESDFPYFLTTILDDNDYSKKILESGRAGMPIYTKIGSIVTHLFPLKYHTKMYDRTTDIKRCDKKNLHSAFTHLTEWNKNHDFSPVYSLDEIKNPSDSLRDFNLSSLYISYKEDKVIGTMGVWNQQSFKQTVVANYSKQMKLVRPLYNAYCYLNRLPYLPDCGENINMLYASFLSIKDDNVFTLWSLIEKAIYDRSGYTSDWLAVGLLKNSPLEISLRNKSKRQIESHIYAVHFDKLIKTTCINPHLEIAFL